MSLGKLKRVLECFPDEEEGSTSAPTRIVRERKPKDYTVVYESIQNGQQTDQHSVSDMDTNTSRTDETSEQLLHEIHVPLEISRLVKFIEDENLQQRFMPGRLFMNFSFEICEDPQSETKGQQRQEIDVEFLNDDAMTVEDFFRRPAKPRLLCAFATAHSGTRMPVDTIFGLKSKEVQQPTSSGNGSGNAYTSGSILLHRFTSENREVLPLYGNALIFEEPLTKTRFSSIEAINFSSVDFYLHIAKRVEIADAPHIARLFCINNYQRLMRRQHIPCMRHAISDQCFFLVPLKYAYQSLLTRVHIYLSVRQHHADQYHLSSSASGDVLNNDPSIYILPKTPDFVIFDCDSLSNVIQFIDSQLINAHPLFNLSDIRGFLRPFVVPPSLQLSSSTKSQQSNGFERITTTSATTPSNWLNVWNDRFRISEQLKNSSRHQLSEKILKRFEMRISCLFYYIDVPPELQRDKLDPSPRRPTRRPPPLLQSINNTTTDDDEPDDANNIMDHSQSSTLIDNGSYERDATAQSQPVLRVSAQAHIAPRGHHSEEKESVIEETASRSQLFEKTANGSEFMLPSSNNHTSSQIKNFPALSSVIVRNSVTPTDVPGTPQKTPRTEPISDPSTNNPIVIGSATTDSNDGEDDSEMKSTTSNEQHRLPTSNGSITPKPTEDVLSTTPYSPFPHHLRESASPQKPPFNDQSSGEQTLFHLSSSSTDGDHKKQ